MSRHSWAESLQCSYRSHLLSTWSAPGSIARAQQRCNIGRMSMAMISDPSIIEEDEGNRGTRRSGESIRGNVLGPYRSGLGDPWRATSSGGTCAASLSSPERMSIDRAAMKQQSATHIPSSTPYDRTRSVVPRGDGGWLSHHDGMYVRTTARNGLRR
jgi:hypothetical protein